MNYDETMSEQSITIDESFTTWDDFFGNTDASNCPITSCSISSAGNCGANDFGGTDHIQFGTTSPWSMTMALNIESGYSYDVCI